MSRSRLRGSSLNPIDVNPPSQANQSRPSVRIKGARPWRVSDRRKTRLLRAIRRLNPVPSSAESRGSISMAELQSGGASAQEAAIRLVNGNLLVGGRPLLVNVPQNVSLCSHPAGRSGAFLGATAPDRSCRHVFSLGVLEGHRFLCLFRFKLWWMTQMMGSCGKDLPHETQFLLLESKDSVGQSKETIFTVFLPILDGSFRSVLQGNEKNEIELVIESGDPDAQTHSSLRAVYIYSGDNPFRVVSDGMRNVQEHLQSFSLRTDKKLPGMLDCFGWCTWDAFYTDVSAEGVRRGLESLAAGGTPAKFLIIDDGWQSVAGDPPKSGTEIVTSGTQYASRLVDIKENRKFPRKNGTTGLQTVVEEMKQIFELKYVYIWHALLGYWGGVKPGYYQATLTYPVHSAGVLKNDPIFEKDSLTVHGVGLPHPETVFDLYNDLHGYLASCGIDGVKVDVQTILESLAAGHGGRVQITKGYHQALEASVARHFPNNGCISCMCHNNDGLYSSKQTAVARVSDDFWPRDPASHTTHIASVAYNSLFMGEVFHPDWDMFQSLHPAAEYHAAARAIGGCGVYVSDKPGQHDFNLLKKLVLPDGSVLRAELPGRPTRDSLFVDPLRDGLSLLKIWNMNKHTGVLGAFNCQGAGWCRTNRTLKMLDDYPAIAVKGMVRAADVELLSSVAESDWNGESVLYSHKRGELLRVGTEDDVAVHLETLEYELFTVVPLKKFSNGDLFAPIGLVDMLNAGGAIRSLQFSSNETGNTVTMTLHGCGQFGAFCSRRPKSCIADLLKLAVDYRSTDGLLLLDVPATDDLVHQVAITL